MKFSACTPSHFPLKTICYGAVREADADSPRCERSGAFRHGHDKDGDDGGLFALHARRFYTDWGTVRSRHENSSGERASHVSYRAQDVKSHWVQSGMDHFVDRSRKLRLRFDEVRIDNRIEKDNKRMTPSARDGRNLVLPKRSLDRKIAACVRSHAQRNAFRHDAGDSRLR